MARGASDIRTWRGARLGARLDDAARRGRESQGPPVLHLSGECDFDTVAAGRPLPAPPPRSPLPAPQPRHRPGRRDPGRLELHRLRRAASSPSSGAHGAELVLARPAGQVRSVLCMVGPAEPGARLRVRWRRRWPPCAARSGAADPARVLRRRLRRRGHGDAGAPCGVPASGVVAQLARRAPATLGSLTLRAAITLAWKARMRQASQQYFLAGFVVVNSRPQLLEGAAARDLVAAVRLARDVLRVILPRAVVEGAHVGGVVGREPRPTAVDGADASQSVCPGLEHVVSTCDRDCGP